MLLFVFLQDDYTQLLHQKMVNFKLVRHLENTENTLLEDLSK